MSTRAVVRILLLAAAFATATAALGWWSVPLLGFLWTALGGGAAARPRQAALAAAIAWTALLARLTVDPASSVLSRELAGVFRVSASALAVTVILYAAALAWTAAVVGAWARAARRPSVAR
jgi:hypothetical protein